MTRFYLAILLFCYSATTLIGHDRSTNPLTAISDYVATQAKPYTAYDLATHFTTTTTFGTPEEFNAGNIDLFEGIEVTALSSTSFVVAYRDDRNSDQGTAIVGTVSGTTITYGNAFVFNAASTGDPSITALSSTSFVVAYTDFGNSGHGTAIVGTVSVTDDITYDDEFVFNAAFTSFLSIAALSSTSFVVAYNDGGNSGHGTAIIGMVSGIDITYGDEVVFNAASTNDLSITTLSSTSFVVAYRDVGNIDEGTAIVGTVSGADITYDDEFVFNAASTSFPSIAALSSTSFVVAYQDVGNSNQGTAIVGTVSGTTITYGNKSVFNAAPTLMNNRVARAMNSTQFVVVFSDAGDGVKGKVRIGTVSGTGTTATIAFGSEEEFTTQTFFPSVASLTDQLIGPPTGFSTKYVIAYDDRTDSNHGYAIIGDASNDVVPVELTFFRGQATTNGNALQWQTASEFNNDGFEVQRSSNGKEWKKMGFVAGNGTTVETQDYTFLDERPIAGANYYRLKQIDFDGTFEYSDVVAISDESAITKDELTTFPNPVMEVLNYQVTDMEAVRSVQLFDVFGKLVKVAARVDGQLSLSDLATGMYVLVVETNRSSLQQIVVKN